MTERSGIDMIEELLKEIKTMRSELKVLDRNVKKIANSAKIAEITEKVLNTPFRDWAKANTSGGPNIKAAEAPAIKNINKDNLRFSFESVDASKTKQPPVTKTPQVLQQPEMCMCSGKMVAQSSGKQIPLPGLDVKIFDDKDKLAKETKTNRAGSWMSQLPPGNYVANIEGKYGGKDLYPVNITFSVKSGMKQLEVK